MTWGSRVQGDPSGVRAGGVTGCPFHPAENPPSKTNPGLVVVICLFVAVLVGAAALLLVRLCRCRTPGFQRLDEVPMVS